MKKYLYVLMLSAGFMGISAQTNEQWRLGFQFGFQGNHAQLIGGDKMADARFEQNNAGAAGLNLFARYDYNQHWMLLTGIGLSSYGFEFSLANKYALSLPESRRTVLKGGIGLLEIPFMLHYKFNPNCKQVKWIVGAGFIQNLQGGNRLSVQELKISEGYTGIGYFNCEVKQSRALFPTIRFSVGREKQLEGGGILNCSLLLNYGFAQNARATVNYEIDGQAYTHQFGNRGNYAGIRIAYYLAPFKQ